MIKPMLALNIIKVTKKANVVRITRNNVITKITDRVLLNLDKHKDEKLNTVYVNLFVRKYLSSERGDQTNYDLSVLKYNSQLRSNCFRHPSKPQY